MQHPLPSQRLDHVKVLELPAAFAVTGVPELRRTEGIPHSRTGDGRLVVGGRGASVEPDFEEFVAARGPALVRLARGLLRDPYHAEDVVQEVLAKALVRWGRIQRADDPDAYVRRMVVNASTSFFRRAVRRERAYEHSWLPERPQPDGAGDHAERLRMLELLRGLPTKQRAVLVLRHYEGLPDAEIAELLNCSPVTVRSNAHRGLAALRAQLDRPEPEGGGRRGR